MAERKVSAKAIAPGEASAEHIGALVAKFGVTMHGVPRFCLPADTIQSSDGNVVLLDGKRGAPSEQLSRALAKDDTDAAIWFSAPPPTDPIFDEMDLAFFDRGLLRVETANLDGAWRAVYVKSSYIRDWTWLNQPRRHVISMPSLGENGRFGNQIFQAVFLSLYALRSNCTVLAPRFEAADVFDFPFSPSKAAAYPRLNFGNNHGDADLLMEARHPPRDVEIWGYFQHITRAHLVHRDMISRMLTPAPGLREPFEEWWRQVRAKFPRIYAVHVRRGDYSPYDGGPPDKFTQTPIEWYVEWLEREGVDRDQEAGVFISTDQPALKSHFSKFRLVYDTVPPPADLDGRFTDLFGLSASDAVLYCNSSWSWAAALMARPGQRATIVDFGAKSFRPFDPWAREDFWLPFDSAYRDPYDMPLRFGGQALAEQKYLDRWRAQAELAYIAKYPLRFVGSLALQRLRGSRAFMAVAKRTAPDQLKEWISNGESTLSHRRQIRALINARGRVTCRTLDER